MKYSDTYSISLMCDVLNISRASFYYHFYYYVDKSNYIKNLLIRISQIYYDSKRTYGAPRITAVLRKEGHLISERTVGKYMNFLNIKSIAKEFFPKKNSPISEKDRKNIINRIKDIDLIRPNQIWVTDITYIKTKEEGWVYLSSIIDLFSRKVIAWNVDYNMKKELVIQTLNNAFKSRNYPINVIIHSDKGSQYRSHEFRNIVAKHNCLSSFTSFHHSCDENANQESFHATLKKEWLYHKDLYTKYDVERAVFEYIEGFYNNKRIHSALGFVSPNDFENNFYANIPLISMSKLLT